MRAHVLLPALLIAAVGFIGPQGEALRDPQNVNIVAACNPSANPHVEPQQVHIRLADNVVWRATGAVASFTITPKDPQRWPFPGGIAGTPEVPASSTNPAPGTAPGTYSYNVIIQCADGSTQVIDPDIIIGENQ